MKTPRPTLPAYRSAGIAFLFGLLISASWAGDSFSLITSYDEGRYTYSFTDGIQPVSFAAMQYAKAKKPEKNERTGSFQRKVFTRGFQGALGPGVTEALRADSTVARSRISSRSPMTARGLKQLVVSPGSRAPAPTTAPGQADPPTTWISRLFPGPSLFWMVKLQRTLPSQSRMMRSPRGPKPSMSNSSG